MDIHELKSLFSKYNQKYFEGKLHKVRLGWSDRMTLCAGKTYFKTINSWKACDIRLSKPLLSQRPLSDTVNTLLHEMIHAYLNLTMGTTLRESHGPEFRKQMNRINAAEKTKITIYHSFHKEVDKYRIHIYRCDGPCQSKKPYFGVLKRAIERPPGPEDPWWIKHNAECWGTFRKISGPGADKEAEKTWKTPIKRAEEPASYALAVKQLNSSSELHRKFSEGDCGKTDLNMKGKFLNVGQEKERKDEIVKKIKAKHANQRATVLLPQKSKGWNETSSCSVGLESKEESYISSCSKTKDGQKLVDGKLNPNYHCRTPQKIKVVKYLAKYQLATEGKETSHIHTSPDMKLVNGNVVWNYEQRTPSKILAEKYIERFKNAIRRELGDLSDQDKPYVITPSGQVVYNVSSETNESSGTQEEPEPPEVEISSSGKKKRKAVKQSNLITRYLKKSEPSLSSQSVSSTDDNDDFKISLTASSEIRKAKRKLYEDDSPAKSTCKIPKLSVYSKYDITAGKQSETTSTDTDLQNQTSDRPSVPTENILVKCSRSVTSDLSRERKENDQLINKAKVSDFKDEKQSVHVDSIMDMNSKSSSLHHTKEDATDCTKEVFNFKKNSSDYMDDNDRVHEISQNISDIKKESHHSSSVSVLKKSDSVDTSKTDCALCGKTVSIYSYEDHLAQCMWDDDLTQDICAGNENTSKTSPYGSGKKVHVHDSFKTEDNNRSTEQVGENCRNEEGRSLPIGYRDDIKRSIDEVTNRTPHSDSHNRHKVDKAGILNSKEYVTSTGCNNTDSKSRRINNSQQPGCSKWYTSEKLVSKNKEEMDPDKSLPCHICGNEVFAAELDVHLNFCTVDDDFSEELAEVFDKDSDDDDFFSQKGDTSESGAFLQDDRSSSPVICPVCKERMDPECLEEHIKLCISFMFEDEDFT